jgi:hypothetical protein
MYPCLQILPSKNCLIVWAVAAAGEEGGVQGRNEGHVAPQRERTPRPEYGLLLVL